MLGPLANPARPAAQAIGCADVRMAPLMAGVFARRGVDAWVFRGEDGLDELTTTGASRVWAVRGGAVTEARVTPGDVGLEQSAPESLRGGDVTHNAEVVRDLLAGRPGRCGTRWCSTPPPGSRCTPADEGEVVDQLRAARPQVEAAIDSGRAAGLLERWVAATRA